MTKDEALKLAIQLRDTASGYWTEQEIPIIEKLIEILAQQEPFGYFKATPFGWTDCAETDEGAIALYEAPPQRSESSGKPAAWVGLTDEEVRQMCGSVPSMREAVRETESKLKEKNT